MRGCIAYMPECPEVCGQEAAGLMQFDTPRVANDEWVCRTVRPEDYSAKNVLKPSFIQTKRLRDGELSAWRLADTAELPELAAKLAANGQAPENVLATKAARLRMIPCRDRLRAVSVINDTRIDDAGNEDAQHITIAPCAELMAAGDPDVVTLEIRAQLMLVYRSSETVALKPRPGT